MTKRRTRTGAQQTTRDSYNNMEARLGLQSNNQAAAGNYSPNYTSRNHWELESMYRSSWICGVAVDSVAEDMTRAGIDINSQLDPTDLEKLNRGIERMRIWDQICDVIKWARLYGGALGVLLIDGQDVSTPLRPETVGIGQFKGILPMDRWMVWPDLGQLVSKFGPDFGKPMFYNVVAQSMALPRMHVHYSRVVRIDGQDLPYWQRLAENLWGQSVLERLIDRLLAFDSTTQGAAQLVFKAHLRTIKIKDYRRILAVGGDAYKALIKSIEHIRRFQSNEGLTVLDAEDDFDAQQYTFSGLDAVLLQFGQQLSGALQIPLVRLFGQSPAGLNATGESDMRNYYDGIKQQQERRLRSPIETVLDLSCRSTIGVPLPDGSSYEFNTLWQMSDTEKADAAEKTASAVTGAYEAQIIDRSTALNELRQSSRATGVFSKITDQDVEQAKNDPPPGMGEMPPDPMATEQPGVLDRLLSKFKGRPSGG